MPENKALKEKGNSYNSAGLEEVRKKIDELDNRIHDTLMERAELVLKVSAEKKKNNIQIVQPAREARMIRRLLSRHKGVLPEMAVVRIWRELVGAVSLLQTGLKVSVAVQNNNHEYWDLARDYFGSSLPMSRASTAVSAISAVKDGLVTFAVVPFPTEAEEQPWWTFLGPNTPEEMSIIVSLPHGDDPKNSKPDCRALVVSKAGFDSSGEDRSFLLIQCEGKNSRASLVDIAKKAGLTALSISSKRTTAVGVPSLHLMEVEDYVAKDDARVKEFTKLLDDPGASVACVGGYPVPPVYSKTVEVQTNDESAKASS
jgi:chorismate mutase/prephenate dehydratase